MVTAAVLAVLLMAGAQDPTMLLLAVVGSAGILAPLQYGPTCVNVGMMFALTVMVAACAVTVLEQAPTATLDSV